MAELQKERLELCIPWVCSDGNRESQNGLAQKGPQRSSCSNPLPGGSGANHYIRPQLRPVPLSPAGACLQQGGMSEKESLYSPTF